MQPSQVAYAADFDWWLDDSPRLSEEASFALSYIFPNGESGVEGVFLFRHSANQVLFHANDKCVVED